MIRSIKTLIYNNSEGTTCLSESRNVTTVQKYIRKNVQDSKIFSATGKHIKNGGFELKLKSFASHPFLGMTLSMAIIFFSRSYCSC